MKYPLVRELADGIPVTVTCRVLNIARQRYYRWLRCPVTDRELADAHPANAISDAHRDNPKFGYRLDADEIRTGGHNACDRTVWRHYADNGWWSVFGRAKNAKKAKVGAPAHDDLVRLHPAQRPGQPVPLPEAPAGGSRLPSRRIGSRLHITSGGDHHSMTYPDWSTVRYTYRQVSHLHISPINEPPVPDGVPAWP